MMSILFIFVLTIIFVPLVFTQEGMKYFIVNLKNKVCMQQLLLKHLSISSLSKEKCSHHEITFGIVNVDK